MANPYTNKGPDQFWRTAVVEVPCAEMTPTPAKRFAIPEGAIVSTAGSCFAQHVANFLGEHQEVTFLEAEPRQAGQPRFSAAYGNIYTVRHLRQLIQEAFGTRPFAAEVWCREDGRYVDSQRPFVFPDGFGVADEVRKCRRQHLQAVRRVFVESSVFVFTMGLTEAWVSTRDDTVYPVAPGVVCPTFDSQHCQFHNFSYAEIVDDFGEFLQRLHTVNPAARVILTVSPVPLTATYTDEHVLVATTHSKATLRAACGALEASHDNVFYFPSFEIISGHYNRGAYYESNLRSVTGQGVRHVMRVFAATYLRDAVVTKDDEGLVSQREPDVFCDEEEVVKSIGFADESERSIIPSGLTAERATRSVAVTNARRWWQSLPAAWLNVRKHRAKVLVISNCATHAYVAWLKALFPHWKVWGVATQVAREWLDDGSRRSHRLLAKRAASIDLYVGFEPNWVSGHLAINPEAQRILIPPFSFRGLHPDAVEIPEVPSVLEAGHTHSRIIATSYLMGKSIDRTVASFCREVYDSLGYSITYAAERQQLIQRYADAGIDIRGAMGRWERRGNFLHTHNHPKVYVFFDILCLALSGEILSPALLWRTRDLGDAIEDNAATSIVWPAYGGGERRLGICEPLVWRKGRLQNYERLDLATFVERSFRQFDAVSTFDAQSLSDFEWCASKVA